MTQPLERYQQDATRTASPGKLIVMLYDGCLKFMNQAREAIEAGDINTAGNRITRAQDIVRELRVSLDMERGGEIAANLAALYLYVLEQQTMARVSQTVEGLDSATRTMTELRDAWAQIQNTPIPAAGEQAPARPGVNLVS